MNVSIDHDFHVLPLFSMILFFSPTKALVRSSTPLLRYSYIYEKGNSSRIIILPKPSVYFNIELHTLIIIMYFEEKNHLFIFYVNMFEYMYVCEYEEFPYFFIYFLEKVTDCFYFLCFQREELKAYLEEQVTRGEVRAKEQTRIAKVAFFMYKDFL